MTAADTPLGRSLVAVAAEWAEVTPDDIFGTLRHVRPSMARQGVMFVLVRDHGWSLAEVGQLLRRDHSTIAKGWKRFDALLPNDADALDIAARLRMVRVDGQVRDEIAAQRGMAMAVIEMGRATRAAIEQMERAARAVLRLTEGYE